MFNSRISNLRQGVRTQGILPYLAIFLQTKMVRAVIYRNSKEDVIKVLWPLIIQFPIMIPPRRLRGKYPHFKNLLTFDLNGLFSLFVRWSGTRLWWATTAASSRSPSTTSSTAAGTGTRKHQNYIKQYYRDCTQISQIYSRFMWPAQGTYTI